MMITRQHITAVTIFFTLSLSITAKTIGDSQIPAKVIQDEMHVSEEPMKQRLRKNGMKLKGKRLRYMNTERYFKNELDEREKTARRRAKKCPSKGPLSKKCNDDNDSSNASDTSSSTTEGDASGSTSETSSVSSAEDNGADKSENSDSENNDSSISGSVYAEGAETNNDEENNGNDNDNANDNANGNGNDNDATSNASHATSVNYDKYDNDNGESSTTNGDDVYNQNNTNGDDTQDVEGSIQSDASSTGETLVEKFESNSAKMWGIIAASCSLVVALAAMAVYNAMTPKDDQGKEVPLTAAGGANNKKGGSRNAIPVADDGSDLFYVRV